VPRKFCGELTETLYPRVSQPGIHKDLAEAKADVAEGRTFTEDEVRARYAASPADVA
jgi:hypothetical protein